MSSIWLLPLGNADHDLLKDLCFPLRETFRSPVEVVESAIQLEDFHDESRGQYNSTSILLHLKQRHSSLSPDTNYPTLLAVVAYDLFIPILTYVFGEAELGGGRAVVSYYRLKNERYGLPPDPGLLNDRLCKEACHELGHAYGLVHCHVQECVMHTSTYVEDIDLKSSTFCATCRKALDKKNESFR